METIVINVGGTVFETTPQTLERFPSTLLGRLNISHSAYNEKKEQYFFDRNPFYFHSILDLYRIGSLHLPEDVCGATLRDELEFWEISKENISDCCLQAYFKHDNEMEVINNIKEKFESPGMEYSDENGGKVNRWLKIKRAVWLFLDQPTSSLQAKIYQTIFLTIVLMSTISFCIGTLPELREKLIPDDVLEWLLSSNTTELPPAWRSVNFDNPKERLFATTVIISALKYIEWACGAFFSLELILHFAFCPTKSRFFRDLLNILDLILFIDIWVIFGMEQNGDVIFSAQSTTNLYIFFKSMAILRLFRFFRLVKFYSGLRIMFMAFFASLKELILLFLVFMIASFFFASFMFYAEFQESTTFPNMVIGVWWAIVTMTTLGYGDHYPKSAPGYIVGTICSICGLLILAMPIAIVANNFNSYYLRNKEREQLNEIRKRYHSKNSSVVFPFSSKKEVSDITEINIMNKN